MDRPQSLDEIRGQPLPDITLEASDGTPFSIRSRVGFGSIVLFFYIRNGTPG